MVFFIYSWLISLWKIPYLVNYNNIDPSQLFKAMDFLNVAFVMFVSWLILRLKINKLVKAVYTMFPMTVIFTTIMDFRWMVTSYILEVMIYLAVIFYLIMKKKPWVYMYAVTVTALFLLYLVVFNVEV